MKLTDEQYEQIGRQLCEFIPLHYKVATALGREAVAAVAPLLLREPDDDELIGPYSWRDGIKQLARDVLRNRLASLTAKPDPAADAVKAEVYKQGRERGLDFRERLDFAAIVAVVDAARAK